MFKILSYKAANDLVKENPGIFNVISCEPNSFVEPELCKSHLHLKFDDLSDNHNREALIECGFEDIVFPEKEDVQAAIYFSRKFDVDIIHCHAGVSRSSAIGYAILRSRGLTKEQAHAKILEINPNAWPNKRIVRFADELYG